MGKITVNDFLIQELNRIGVKDFFGLPGDYNFNIIDAVEKIQIQTGLAVPMNLTPVMLLTVMQELTEAEL